MKSTFQGAALDGEELIPLVYGELHRLAASRMANERPGHTLQERKLDNLARKWPNLSDEAAANILQSYADQVAKGLQRSCTKLK